jgi:Skp family chaperone for outer membrane proteins
MTLKFTKFLCIFSIIFLLVVLLPTTALASSVTFYTNSAVTIAITAKSSLELNLTPQVRQQLQAVRQRRNREIQKVLDSSQLTKLTQNLRSGDDFHQALDRLNLQGDQKEMVEAIVKICNLKTKAILSRFSP